MPRSVSTRTTRSRRRMSGPRSWSEAPASHSPVASACAAPGSWTPSASRSRPSRRAPSTRRRRSAWGVRGGEGVIGRLVTPEGVVSVYASRGGYADHAVSAEDVGAAVMERGAGISLAGGLSLRRARVMDAVRGEVAGVPAGAVDQMKALGLMSEIITWRLRLFIPTTDAGVAILGRLLDRHPFLQGTAQARI